MTTRRTVLVTGGCGFIGANFVKRVVHRFPEWRIINLDKLTYAGNLISLEDVADHVNYRFVRGDICDSSLLNSIFEEEGVDTLIHFAAESHVDRSIAEPGSFIQTNIMGTFSLLECARYHWQASTASQAQNIFLHVSTDEVYGSLPETGLFTEATAYDPRSPYSASKASSDHLARSYFHTYGLPVMVTNCSNNYGPYQFPEKLIPLVFRNCLLGRELPVYGDGKNVRDWLYVEDHCEAILAVMERGSLGESYNIGGNSERQNIEVVQRICDRVDERVGRLPSKKPRRSLVTYVKDRKGHDRRYAIDASKLKEKTGWEPSLSFEDGIGKTIDWYLDNADWLEGVIDGSYSTYYDRMYGDR